MRLHARFIVQALLFIVATLGATGLLVAAGLNEEAASHAQPGGHRAAK